MLMMGLKVLGLWESGRCVLLWSGNSTKAPGARTGSPCHKQYYRVGMGQQWGFGDGREIKMPDTIDHFKAPPHHPSPCSIPKPAGCPSIPIWKTYSTNTKPDSDSMLTKHLFSSCEEESETASWQ